MAFSLANRCTMRLLCGHGKRGFLPTHKNEHPHVGYSRYRRRILLGYSAGLGGKLSASSKV